METWICCDIRSLLRIMMGNFVKYVNMLLLIWLSRKWYLVIKSYRKMMLSCICWRRLLFDMWNDANLLTYVKMDCAVIRSPNLLGRLVWRWVRVKSVESVTELRKCKRLLQYNNVTKAKYWLKPDVMGLFLLTWIGLNFWIETFYTLRVIVPINTS